MKARILTILIFAGLCFSACQKESVAPAVATTPTTQTTASSSTPLNQNPTYSDSTKGYLRVQLAKDPVNTDEVLVVFNPTARNIYVANEDAPTFQGFGQVSLSTLSADNVALAINTLPLSPKGTTVRLVVHAKSSGLYKLNLTDIHSIPSTIDIWLKDRYRKDSLDFRQYKSYAFDINSDTSSYGSRRFCLVMRAHQ